MYPPSVGGRSGGCVFFFNDTATTEIYTLSLHDALPISLGVAGHLLHGARHAGRGLGGRRDLLGLRDRKSTRLNSSHLVISYAVFCLKKKKPAPQARSHNAVDRERCHGQHHPTTALTGSA